MSDVHTTADYLNMADQPSRLTKELDKFGDIRLERIAWPMVGVVTKQNTKKYAVTVKLRDYDDVIIDDVPVVVSYIGKTAEINETGEWKLPNIGNLVVLMFANGSWDDPMVVGQLYNDVDKAPYIKREPTPLGHGIKRDLKQDDIDDYHIRHTKDTNFTIDRKGNITLDHKTLAHITIDEGGNVVIHSSEKAEASASLAVGTSQSTHYVLNGGKAMSSGPTQHLQQPYGPNIARIGDLVWTPCGIGIIITGAETAFCSDSPDLSPEI